MDFRMRNWVRQKCWLKMPGNLCFDALIQIAWVVASICPCYFHLFYFVLHRIVSSVITYNTSICIIIIRVCINVRRGVLYYLNRYRSLLYLLLLLLDCWFVVIAVGNEIMVHWSNLELFIVVNEYILKNVSPK